MTSAPSNLLAVRRLLLDHLNIEPDKVRDVDLEPAELGVVGDTAHRGGYHCGLDRVVRNDYSVVESDRDSKGLTLDASALDVGMFEVRSAGRTHNLRTFSTWCVAQCVANTPDSRDIREIIYSPDGRTVRRWDRLHRRTTGDTSHLWHTHFSFFRDSTKARRDQTPLFRRYLTTIGLLEGPDMTPEEHAWLETVHRHLTVLDGRNPIGQIYTRTTMGEDHTGAKVPGHPTLKTITNQLAAVQAGLTTLAGQDFTDETAIVDGVLAGMTPERLGQAFRAAGFTPEAIAAAVPADMARQVADLLAARLVD